MIPENRFSTTPVPGNLLNPWSLNIRVSYQWGPVAVQDPSQGLLVKVWTLEAIGKDAWLSAPGVAPYIFFSRAVDIFNVNLAFDGNGNPCVAFQEITGTSYFYWFDPVPNAYVFFTTAGMEYPRCTMDDSREASSVIRDVILAYIRAGAIHYRQLRDRYTIEYTPTVGPLGPPVSANILYNISMNEKYRLEFLYGSTPFIKDKPVIMRKQINIQKAPVEQIPLVYNFYSLMQFGEVIEAGAVSITVESGTDPNPDAMLEGACTVSDHEVTQIVSGGIPGNVYRVAMSARTDTDCIYVTEGLLYVNDSPAIEPA